MSLGKGNPQSECPAKLLQMAADLIARVKLHHTEFSRSPNNITVGCAVGRGTLKTASGKASGMCAAGCLKCLMAAAFPASTYKATVEEVCAKANPLLEQLLQSHTAADLVMKIVRVVLCLHLLPIWCAGVGAQC